MWLYADMFQSGIRWYEDSFFIKEVKMTDLMHLMESNSYTAGLMGHVTLRKLFKQFRPLSQNFKMEMILPECQFHFLLWDEKMLHRKKVSVRL